MANAIIKALFKLILSFLNIILYPLNTLITQIFPDVSNVVSTFTTFCNTFLTGSLAFFGGFIPPMTKGIVILWLTFLIGYYPGVWLWNATIKVFNVIQKIKFW